MPPDLYTEILGLPPEPRPLNYYELLALPLFEADREVIHAAVLRQTKELKRWALHPDPATMLRIQEMLNEVNRAGFDLEKPETKADYDRQLADRLGIPLPQRPAAASAPPAPLGERGPGGEERSRLPLPPTPSPLVERGPGGEAPRAAGPLTPHPPLRLRRGGEEGDAASGWRRAPRSPALIAALAMGIPLAAAALFWVGFFLGRRSSSEERDLATQRSANAAQAQAAAEARAGQLGEEVKKAQAQAASEAKARAAAEREARRLAQALKEKPAIAAPAGSAPTVPTPETPAVPSVAPVVNLPAGPFKVYTAWPFDAVEAKRRQAETARALGAPVEQDFPIGPGVKMTFVLIPAGEFLMGGDEQGYDNEKPVHKVTLTKPFFLGKHEVTQEQWQTVMAGNPSYFKGAKNPVDSVSWFDCQSFVEALNEKLPGRKFRLPTEAEWEYVCRAGTSSRFGFGDQEADLSDYGWFSANSQDATHPVAQKNRNAWGLCDMHGNVWEWCSDWFGPYAGGDQKDPQGPPNGTWRVLRGGAWSDYPANCRSAHRSYNPPEPRPLTFGFRLARPLP